MFGNDYGEFQVRNWKQSKNALILESLNKVAALMSLEFFLKINV